MTPKVKFILYLLLACDLANLVYSHKSIESFESSPLYRRLDQRKRKPCNRNSFSRMFGLIGRPTFFVESKCCQKGYLGSSDTKICSFTTQQNPNLYLTCQKLRGGKKDDGKGSVVIEAQENTSIHPRLVMLIRLLFISYYGSLGALMPYLPVFFHSLGHSGHHIGLLGAIKPFTTFVVAPLWGVLSDYTSSPSTILHITFITSCVLQLFLPMRDNVDYLVTMVFLTALFNAPVKSLIDSMVLDKLSDEEKGNYGKLRLWGQMGFGLGSSVVGILISQSTSNKNIGMDVSPSPVVNRFVKSAVEIAAEAGATAAATEEISKTALQTLSDMLYASVQRLYNASGFEIAFIFYGLLSIPTFICMKAFQRYDGSYKNKDTSTKKTKQEVTKEGAKILQGLNLIFHNTDALLFFFLVFVVGTTSGIIENFAYVRIREVGGEGKQMGLCRLVSSMAGAPMFWFSGPLTAKLGVDRVLVLSLISYVVRFLNYAFIRKPLHALPAEALRGVTFAAFWSTGTVFAHKISPEGMKATMLLFMNAMYGGLGQSIGAYWGGKLQSNIGTVNTFLYSAAADAAFICFVSVYLNSRKTSNFRDPQPLSANSVQ